MGQAQATHHAAVGLLFGLFVDVQSCLGAVAGGVNGWRIGYYIGFYLIRFGELMPFYKRHAFICANQSTDGSACCQDHNALAMVKYAKGRLKELGAFGPGGVRLNKSGCMGRCAEGPVLVVYPDDVWYTYVDKGDIEEIITEHLVHGRRVGRLEI